MIMKNNLAMCTQKVAHPNLQLMLKNMNDIVGYTKYSNEIKKIKLPKKMRLILRQIYNNLYHSYIIIIVTWQDLIESWQIIHLKRNPAVFFYWIIQLTTYYVWPPTIDLRLNFRKDGKRIDLICPNVSLIGIIINMSKMIYSGLLRYYLQNNDLQQQ